MKSATNFKEIQLLPFEDVQFHMVFKFEEEFEGSQSDDVLAKVIVNNLNVSDIVSECKIEECSVDETGDFLVRACLSVPFDSLGEFFESFEFVDDQLTDEVGGE